MTGKPIVNSTFNKTPPTTNTTSRKISIDTNKAIL